jgi:FeS assembly protein IscX
MGRSLASEEASYKASPGSLKLMQRGRLPMPVTFDWDDAEEIGIQLAEKYPDSDPLSVRYTDLHKWVTSLEGFMGDPKLSNEGKLEAIQMAWLEEHNERKS